MKSNKYNIVDILICVLILAFFVGVIIRFVPFFSSDDIQAINTPKTIEYTVVVRDVRDYTVRALEKFGPAYTSNGAFMGQVVDVYTKPFTDIEVLNDGTQYKLEAPDKYEVYITIRTDGRESDMLMVGSCGTELYLGAHLAWYTKWVNVNSSEIVSIIVFD
ncbi:MAG: hypothetical protein ATN31_02880 [Candidatus Epulonipiscioides saccharophilum]|nr:MAG: hypothetical protein ATN31_02880 [Epulopiscium sp. AS2M-Bin001]